MRQHYYKIFITAIIVLTLGISGRINVLAQSIDDLKVKIADKNTEIRALEAEINRLDKEIKDTENERQTLNKELRQIDAIKKKLEADIKLTSKKIDATLLNIKNTENSISDKNTRISNGNETIAESLRLINEYGRNSLPEIILSGNSLSMVWGQISELGNLQDKIIAHINNLKRIREDLEIDKRKLKSEKQNLDNLRNQLDDQKKIAEQNIKSKNKLITDTKNKETNFKKLLTDTETRKRAVESELLEYESELRIILDSSKIPESGTKILSWPLDKIYITQHFGLTEFSKTQPIYNGKGHNGIDLRASIGTPLKAAASGIILGTGDTDPVCYGASYGRWIMIDHGNGLASIYGHLSLIKTSAGQKVERGELIGYTGKSGYATGPHLHFTVAATQAVKIGDLKSKVKGCGTYTIPLGPFNGYLNPLSYL